MFRVTVDTNILERTLHRMREAVEGFDVEIRRTTVSVREDGLPPHPENDGVVPEVMVWRETRWGEGVWGPGLTIDEPAVRESFVWDETASLDEAVLFGDDALSMFEAILAVIGDGSFPPPGKRDNLTKGERRQLRDAMILEAHAREGRDVLVSDDRKAFIGKVGAKRAKLEALYRTRIMTVDEFCAGIGAILAKR